MLLTIVFAVQAQSGDVMMTVNDKPVSTLEFEKMYTKNLDLVQDQEQKDIDNYLQLFTHYKLELEDAYAKKYDTLPRFKRELNSYRRDLAKKYLSDDDILEKLIKEAYDRSKFDVRVAHILIQVSPDASPKDTLAAYHKIEKIYQEALQGGDFGKLAQKYSQDPSAKQNKGDLDYINIFHTVYPFETAAYTTPVGKISKPFRTRFGYHIVKVLDKRPALGEVEVAHIMTRDQKDKVKQVSDAKTRIFEIYNKIKTQNGNFEALAKKFSDDKSTAKYGGKLRRFGIRQMIPAFEKVAFSLQKEGDISKPFQTKYGWHIVKLIQKYPVASDFVKAKEGLRYKVMRDARSKLGKEKLMKRIEKEFPIQMIGSLDKVYSLITDDFFHNKWQIPTSAIKDADLFSIKNDEKIKYDDFFKFIYRRQHKKPTKADDKINIINQLFDKFKKEKLFSYYDAHLEAVYPEFAAIMKEYRDGLLMFYIKSDMVWDKSVKDTLGLKNYYDQHKSDFKLPKKYAVLLVQANDKKTAKKVLKAIKKDKDSKYLKSKFKDLIIKKKEYNADDAYVKKHDLDAHQYVMFKEKNEYVILKRIKTYPAHIPSFKDAKGMVTNQYQQYLEKQWIEALQKKYPVHINQQKWQEIRAKYKK